MKQWCIRITWLYYDRDQCEGYIKTFPSFGALHTGTEMLHSHYYMETEYDNKKLRNDLNRYKTAEKPPKGFKALSISELRTTTGQYYDYVCKKPESTEQFKTDEIDLMYPEDTSVRAPRKKTTKTLIEIIEEDIPYNPTMKMEQLGEMIFDWYIERSKVLPNKMILNQVIRTVVARYEYRKKKEWDGQGFNPSSYDGIRRGYVQDALKF